MKQAKSETLKQLYKEAKSKRWVLTQTEFAASIGYSRSQLMRFFNGGDDIPDEIIERAKKVANGTLNVPKLENAEIPMKEDISMETIRDLAKSSVILAEANKLLANNNTELITIFKLTAGAGLKNPVTPSVGETLAPYLHRMANNGVMNNLWSSADEGLLTLGKLLLEDVPVKQQ